MSAVAENSQPDEIIASRVETSAELLGVDYETANSYTWSTAHDPPWLPALAGQTRLDAFRVLLAAAGAAAYPCPWAQIASRGRKSATTRHHPSHHPKTALRGRFVFEVHHGLQLHPIPNREAGPDQPERRGVHRPSEIMSPTIIELDGFLNTALKRV